MKKLLFTFLILLFSIDFAFAEGECLIKDKSSQVLLDYIKNNQTITKEITNQIGKMDEQNTGFINNLKGKWTKIKTDTIRTGNDIFNFNGYFSYFKYFAVFPISNEIPYEIRRDYNILKKEDDGLRKYFENIVKKGKSDLVINNICSKVNGNCEIPNDVTAKDLLAILLKNNDSILNLYRNTVMGEVNLEYTPLILVPTNFREELETYYSPNAYVNCSKEEGGFFDRIEEKIDEIANWQTLAKDGIQKWKDAWALLMGNDTSTQKYQEAEKKLLMGYLGNQGIHGDSQQNALEALEKFNQSGLSKDSNFIYNTYNNTKNQLRDKLKEFWDDNIGDFLKKVEKNSDGSASIPTVIKAQENSTNTNLIKERIEKMYLELSNFEAISETNASTLIGRIIKTHIDIVDSIDILTETCEKAVQVCKQQDSDKGDCGKCN